MKIYLANSIIGGADKPTYIFVSRGAETALYLILMIVVLVIIGLIMYFYINKKW